MRDAHRSRRATRGPAAELGEQHPRDEKAGDHEEDVDPDESSGGPPHGMRADDRQDSKSAQALDVAARRRVRGGIGSHGEAADNCMGALSQDAKDSREFL